MASPFCLQWGKKEKSVQFSCVRPTDGKARDGWNILAGDETLTIHVSIPQDSSQQLSWTIFTILTFDDDVAGGRVGSAEHQMILPGYLVFLLSAAPACGVPHQLGFARPPASKLPTRSNILDRPKNFTSVVASSSCHTASAAGQDPAPGPSGICQMYLLLLSSTNTRSLSPRGPHPL